jgi:hypothetical protein
MNKWVPEKRNANFTNIKTLVTPVGKGKYQERVGHVGDGKYNIVYSLASEKHKREYSEGFNSAKEAQKHLESILEANKPVDVPPPPKQPSFRLTTGPFEGRR